MKTVLLLLSLSYRGFASDGGGCRDLPAVGPADINPLAQRGIALSHAGQYGGAAECYRKVLAIDPKIPQIQLNLGLAEFKQGRFDKAIEPFRAVLALEPKNRQAETLLGMSCYGARKFQEASEGLAAALDADPANAQLHFYLAQSLLWSKQYDKAMKQFEWLERNQPDSPGTHVLMAEALDGLSRPDDAIAELKQAAEKSPSEPGLHFAMGYIHWAHHQDDDAEREFRIELAHDPASARSMAWLGDVAIRRNDAKTALPLLEKAVKLEPGIRIAHLDLGIVLSDTPQRDRAVRELREAIRLDPSQPDAHYRLARVYKSLGRTADANAEFAAVRQLHEKKEDTVKDISGKPPELPQ